MSTNLSELEHLKFQSNLSVDQEHTPNLNKHLAQNPNLSATVAVTSSFFRELSKAKDCYQDFRYIDILNLQLEAFQLKYTERLERRLESKTIHVLWLVATPNSGKEFTEISDNNKSRKIREFKSKAETALWFAESYSLVPQYIKLQSCVGEAVKVDFQPTDYNKSSFQDFSYKEKQKIKDLLFILEKINVSESVYRELTLYCDGLPRNYLISQCRDDINHLYHFERTPGNIPGAYISLENEIIKYVKYQDTEETDKLQIKISGDGSRVSRISNFVEFSFSVITDCLTLSSKDQNVFCIVNCKEDYDSLKNSCKPIFEEINSLYKRGTIAVDREKNRFGNFVRIHKGEREDMTKPWDFYHGNNMNRTAQNLEEDVVRNHYGVRAQPLIRIEPEHIIIDELHLLLRICDKLLSNLIKDTKTLDDKNVIHGEKTDFLHQLVVKIRECGVSFSVWTTKGTQGEVEWSSLMGSDYKRLLENLPSKLCFLIHHDTHDLTVELWNSLLKLYRFLTLEVHQFSHIRDVFEKCKEWVRSYLNLDNIATDALVKQISSNSQTTNRANDGDITSCLKINGTNVRIQVDMKEFRIVTEIYILGKVNTTVKGFGHTIYASNSSGDPEKGTVLYRGASLPKNISTNSAFRYLTYIQPIESALVELEICEIGIVGCPSTKYGKLCEEACPEQCHGPCDLKTGRCIFGCSNGWIGEKCENVRSDKQEPNRAGAVIGGISITIILVILMFLAVIYRHKKSTRDKYSDKSKSSQKTTFNRKREPTDGDENAYAAITSDADETSPTAKSLHSRTDSNQDRSLPLPPPGESTSQPPLSRTKSDIKWTSPPPLPTGAERANWTAGNWEQPDDDHNRKIEIDMESSQLENIYDNLPRTMKTFSIRQSQLELEEELGSGQFGSVQKGYCTLKRKGRIPVAVKKLNSDDKSAEEEMLKEADVMRNLSHQRIVRMIGLCRADCIMLVLELCPCGPLNSFLAKRKEMKQSQVVQLMWQVAQGMSYLHSKNYVHRDLAARNVLLVSENSAKISDFGMSKAFNIGNDYYKAREAGKWPLKWYAPECVYFWKFDAKSDVWSYGVTLWEATSYGGKPYKTMKGNEILKFLVEDEMRLKKPDFCDEQVYEIMLECWQYE
ncbi:Tyrosine-protein kinase receptor Tie-1,Tyrosine-protein kinase Shark,Melanoma receptor tyrosine-protein kinase,Ack-related non-receptor tyrosine kinase,Tyrosine-protein kinase ZAP-70,Vascular endothelial growth factor receptor 1,Receptor tyrosine-protein kinase erbB-4,Tyrosine-protein kinase SYK,Tyrosine-protein kinase Fer [Mytilus coruscus]|uniref:Protein kinase domain-containing protein n=1 Tax=Mytilus coruscus TaxID=42192 RepID=A0A6J8END5_MYTCO|nr:Tyrosine-protein kinase receptor Tie-1,Tyrosine-protein kinase Shark,Melanoma receptor tyrosine-protein kinase,Ack-related non-receptor tyrosine kinase,Tyrosine-protein kinase ZAP-70,Vascular endothelial growth factor receptor 1,Receptor tyrosine-protein kinase erbB-4,Tyrosine-protein kinase SYK,Tyrosine-protein kinase Fer [Mytilus coruscus]